MNYRVVLVGLLIKACIAVILVLPLLPPATGHATSLPGTDIPLIDGARIVKEKQFQGSGRFEFEVDIVPEEAVDFYHQAMQAKGWPAGRIMTVGKNCALMLLHQGDVFSIKAEDKNGRTYVTLAVVLRSSIEKALDPQTAQRYRDAKKPVADPKEKTLPENSNVTIEGTPIGNGDLVRRPELSGRDGSVTGKKDDGNLPDDPSPPTDDDDPDSEDSSTDDSSDVNSGDSVDIRNDIPENLSVSVRVTTRWNVSVPEYERYEGIITLQINGHMSLDAAGSPAVQQPNGTFMPVLHYKPEAMTVAYNYNESGTSLRPIPDGHCADPLLFEYQDAGVSQLNESAGLKIQRSNAMSAPYLKNLSADKQQFMAAMQGAMRIPDYYELYVGGPGRKKIVHGRTGSPGAVDCEYHAAEKTMRGFQVGIQVEFPESGILRGTKTWSADDQGLRPPSLGIHVSDIAPIIKTKPLKPPEGGNKNVTYTVSWQIGQAVNFPGEGDSAEEKDEKDCENMRDRADFIRIVRAAYENQAVRNAINNMPEDENFKKAMYQTAIEKIAMDAANDQSLSDIWEKIGKASDATAADVDAFLAEEALTPPELPVTTDASLSEDKDAKAWLKTKPIFDFNGKYAGTKIYAVIDGQMVTLELYDRNGNLLASEDPADIQKGWEAQQGEMAGQSMFKNCIEHERVHVKQYTRSKGIIKNVDELGDWELESYQKELDGLLKDIDDDC